MDFIGASRWCGRDAVVFEKKGSHQFLDAWFLDERASREAPGTRQRKIERCRRHGRLTRRLEKTVGRSCLRAATLRNGEAMVRNRARARLKAAGNERSEAEGGGFASFARGGGA